MDEPVDYYKILQVSRDASTEVIKASYRVLCRQFHPDLAGSGADHSAMASVNMAYSVLGDSGKRRQYDEELLDYDAWLADAWTKYEEYLRTKEKEKESAREAPPPPQPQQAKTLRPEVVDQKTQLKAQKNAKWIICLQIFYVLSVACASAHWMLQHGIWIEF